LSDEVNTVAVLIAVAATACVSGDDVLPVKVVLPL
jgi:hypothetical protein